MSNAQTWEKVRDTAAAIRREIGMVIVGQDIVVEQMIVALLCKGHCLIVGVPGLAKTLLVSTLGKILGLTYRRIQFTPDLMPTDILGSEILHQDDALGRRELKFVPGPVFAHLILADEINRTPPKTQSALLEAMQEKQVTVAGRTMPLEEPFVVYATQNPIEYEGTYPLPEAQLDRFLFSLVISYPSLAEERRIVLQTTGGAEPEPHRILECKDVLDLQQMVSQVPMPDNVLDHILRLVNSSRPTSDLADDYVKRYVSWGAGPRASQNLARAAKALALLHNQDTASVEEVRELAKPVLRHRIIPSYNATGDGISADQIVDHLLEKA